MNSILLAGLISVSWGTVVWASISFFVVLFLMKKFAWKPILESLDKREKTIEDALRAADKAREDMSSLQAENENLLKQAREERDLLLKEARETRESMIADAKNIARDEADRMIESAKVAIEHDKLAAIAELKNEAATLALTVAEKVVKEQLSNDDKQHELVRKIIGDLKLN